MKSKGVNFSSLFDPDIMGDGPTAPGYKVNGVAQRFADIKYGSKRANIGYAEKGVDLSNKWAAKGTAAYALGFDGGSYSATTGRGSAELRLDMKSNGTWAITRIFPSEAVLATGTWLPSGQAPSDWSCQFSYTASDVLVVGGGSNHQANGASSQISLNATRTFDARSAANLTGQRAEQLVSLTVKLYKNGALRSTSNCNLATSADGN